MKYSIAAFLGTTLLLPALIANAGESWSPPFGTDLSRGKKLYLESCALCHGENGDGQGRAAVAIKDRKPRNFLSENFQYGSSPEEVLKTVTNGISGSAMPPWSSLPEQDRKALVDYILSLKKKRR